MKANDKRIWHTNPETNTNTIPSVEVQADLLEVSGTGPVLRSRHRFSARHAWPRLATVIAGAILAMSMSFDASAQSVLDPFDDVPQKAEMGQSMPDMVPESEPIEDFEFNILKADGDRLRLQVRDVNSADALDINIYDEYGAMVYSEPLFHGKRQDFTRSVHMTKPLCSGHYFVDVALGTTHTFQEIELE